MYEILIQEYGGSFGRGRTVDDIVNCVEELPPMPDVIARALRLVDDSESMPGDLADVIMCDPVLTSAILRLANSAGMGQQQQVSSLAAAIQQIGMGTVKSILYASALRGLNKQFGPLQRMIWEKSLGSACAARVLCDQLKKRYRDELYLTALLHNLGQAVFLSNKQISRIYQNVIERIYDRKETFATAERDIIGFSHPLVGALVAHKWKLPFTTCQAILHYEDPFEGVDGEEDEKLAMLKLAIELGMSAGFGRPQGHPLEAPELSTVAAAVGIKAGPTQSDFLEAARSTTKTQFACESSAYA